MKTVESVLGPLPLERACYHCAACAAGFCPRDRALGLDGTSLSPAVTRMVGIVGAMVSFVEGHAAQQPQPPGEQPTGAPRLDLELVHQRATVACADPAAPAARRDADHPQPSHV